VNRAAIDLGSNSILLTIVGPDGEIAHDEARIVGLGRALGDRGTFLPDRMAAARVAFVDYIQIARRYGIAPGQILAVTTSAARRASNAAAFFARVDTELGLSIRTISGQEEAQLSYVGAQLGLPAPVGPLLVIDVGGGSTEVIVGVGSTVASRRSLEIGSVRLTEARFGLERVGSEQRQRAEAEILAFIETLDWPLEPVAAIAVAGTATTLAAMDAQLTTYDGEVVHGHCLSRSALSRWCNRLQRADARERQQLARVSPKRADYLLAGALVIDAILDAAGLEECTVSDRGLRFGLLDGS
jgi:exopolyphosphatase/guanosine-5'-triphosphate,3'-diphosphate pyrophosphatase